MIRRLETSPEEDAWASEQGELRIRRPAPLVVVFIEKGYLEADFAPLITAEYDASIQRVSKPHIFVDGEFLHGYDPRIRSDATDWVSRNKGKIARQHMLVKSKLAQMGLSVASLMLGGIIVGYSERKDFDEALRRAINETKARPS